MSANADEERVRYDRQIRLWGKSTQQRLMKTHLHFCSIRGALAEVAKNLVLAGVRSVTIEGETPVSGLDLGTNFLLQGGGAEAGGQPVGCTVERLAADSLAALNPHVRVTTGPAPAVDAGAERGLVVVLASASSAAGVAGTRAAHPSADTVVVVADTPWSREGSSALALFSRASGEGSDGGLAALSQRPPQFQAAALALNLADTEGLVGDFGCCVAAAAALVERLGLNELSAAEVEVAAVAACDGAPAPDERSQVPVILATQVGACIAQQIVADIGGQAPATEAPVAWMLCDAGSGMDTLIG